MIRIASFAAAALLATGLALPAQAGWTNGISLNGLDSYNGVSLNGGGPNGTSLHGAAAATGALLQGLTLPNGIVLPR